MFSFVNVGIGKLIQRVLALAAFLSLANAHATTMWIDTDPAIGAPWRDVDDAFALLLAFHSPELHVAGISTSYGNASVARTTEVAKDLVQRFGASVAVHAGARSPADLDSASDATEALAETVRSDHLTYIALAPLTNFASFATLHPDLLPRVDALYFVGGQSQPGLLRVTGNEWLRIHDTNVFKDPKAAAHVLATNVPVTLAPAEVGAHLMITPDGMQQLAHRSAAGAFLRTRTLAWLAFWRFVAGREGGSLFDCLAVLARAEPNIVSTRRAYAKLDGGELRIASYGVREVEVCTTLAPTANAALLSRLLATSPNR